MTGPKTGVKSRLADMLGQVPMMDDGTTRNAIFTRMKDQGFELPLTRAANVPLMCWDVISEAAAQAGALQSLATSVRYFDKSGPAQRFADEVARQLPSEVFALDVRLRFVTWVEALVEPEYLNMYYKLATQDDSAAEFADADDLIRALEDHFNEKRPHPLIMLAHQVAVRKRSRQVTGEARDWCRQLAGLIDASRRDGRNDEQAKLAALWKRHGSRRGSPDTGHATLTLLLDPYVPNPDAGYLLSAWLYRDDLPPVQCKTMEEPAKLDMIRQEVIRQLHNVIRQLRQPGVVPDIMLEFFFPRGLLDHAVEEWVVSGAHVTLGTEFVVVVRDRDRLYDPVLWPRWQQKWNRVARSKPGPDGPFSHWITCADTPCWSGELYPKLLGEDVVSLGLTFPPHPVPEGRHELSEALTAGTPVAVWPRIRCQHPNPPGVITACPGLGFRDRVRLELSGQRLPELPRLVKEMRQSHAGRADAGLALLWDDADRHPPTAADFQLDAPHYLGEI
jgi:vWA-MoxR associated protein C-terminal domain